VFHPKILEAFPSEVGREELKPNIRRASQAQALSKHVLVVGGSGVLGRAISESAQHLGIRATITVRDPRISQEVLDLKSPHLERQIERVLDQNDIDVCIIAAGVASFSNCEGNPEATALVNVDGTLRLVERLARNEIEAIFLSSSAVFGSSAGGMTEVSPTHPESEYGRQKLRVEREILEAGQGRVLRLTKVLSQGDQRWLNWANLLWRGEAISCFENLRFAPLSPAFVAEACLTFALQRTHPLQHLSPRDDLSYCQALKILARTLNVRREMIRSERCISRPSLGQTPDTPAFLSSVFSDRELLAPSAAETVLQLAESISAVQMHLSELRPQDSSGG